MRMIGKVVHVPDPPDWRAGGWLKREAGVAGMRQGGAGHVAGSPAKLRHKG